MNSWIMALKHWNTMKGGVYRVPKKGSKEYLEVKAVQESMINGKGLKQLGKGAHTNKTKKVVHQQNGGSLRKAIEFATNQPEKFAEFTNKVIQQGSGLGKKQSGGFLPLFILPYIPAISTAIGAFATGAAGALGAAAVDEIIGDGMKKSGGQILNPNVDLVKEVEKLLGSGIKKNGRKKKGGSIGLKDLAEANPFKPSNPFEFLEY